METIESLYDAGSSDLRELLWDSCLVEPTLSHDWMMSGKDDEWVNGMTVRDIASLGVVLRDRLMTDAAFGGPRPVKSEHSYSLAAYSSPASPALAGTPAQTRHCEATPMVSDSETRIRSTDNGRPLSLVTKINDMEAECFPAISMNKASSRGQSSSPPPPPPPPPLPAPSLAPLDFRIMAANVATVIEPEQEILEIKDEPIPSPESNFEGDRYNFNRNIAPQLPTHALLLPNSKQTSDSDEEEDYYQNLMEMEESETQHSVGNDEPALQTLPPTPPSSASSDSESAASASCSPERRNFIGTPHMPNLRGFLAPRLYVTNGTTHGHSTRQPIHTSLISCQPKGSTGTLVLTEEEKRTLIAEGYSVPTKLPLTKQEEKSLKKVRRKIKNKISAQESRRKKKEYMDGLERRVSMLTSENSSYRERLSVLEDTNCGLLKELERLKALIRR